MVCHSALLSKVLWCRPATLGSAEIREMRSTRLTNALGYMSWCRPGWSCGVSGMCILSKRLRMPSCGCIITRPAMNSGLYCRGLGGELIRMLTGDHFFAGAYTVLRTSITVWLIALAVVIFIFPRATVQRRIMLALLVPVLPCLSTPSIIHPKLSG